MIKFIYIFNIMCIKTASNTCDFYTNQQSDDVSYLIKNEVIEQQMEYLQ